MQKTLLKSSSAAEFLGISHSLFIKRKYPHDLEIDGVKFYDIEKIKDSFIDGRLKK